MIDAMTLIERALAQPKTHAVLTRYADGSVRRFETRNAGSAENHAVGERRKIGRDLLARDPDTLEILPGTVRVVSVEVFEIAERDRLAREYVDRIGYDPFADDPANTVEEVRTILAEHNAIEARGGLDA